MIKTTSNEKKLFAKRTDLKLWEKNPRSINKVDFERLKKQLQKLGQYKPLLVTVEGVVLGGNMRLRAYEELNVDNVWISLIDPKTEAEKLEYALSDNDRAGYYDGDLLANLSAEFPTFEWADFAVDLQAPMNIAKFFEEKDDDKYSRKVEAPIYTPSGTPPLITELVNKDKASQLIAEMANANIPAEIKEFLLAAAYRHFVFDYGKIADYYAHADKTVQDLFEKSALVIIDYNKAIENGYINLVSEIFAVQKEDYE